MRSLQSRLNLLVRVVASPSWSYIGIIGIFNTYRQIHVIGTNRIVAAAKILRAQMNADMLHDTGARSAMLLNAIPYLSNIADSSLDALINKRL